MGSQMALAPLATGAHEIASTSAAAQSMAAVQARYALAVARPRDDDEVRVRLLKDCRRPGFAEVARYSKPIGGTNVEGPSIRFVEAALRAFRNILREVVVLYDAAETRVVRVAVTDLEANITHQTDLTITKTVERRRVRDGQEVVGERVNTGGHRVFIVRATEDELSVKQAAMVSKAIRELGLRILPGDLVDEAQAECAKTRLQGISEDPEAARKRIADAFVSLGVQPADLAKYLGHPIGQSTPREIAELRQIHASIKDGESTWVEAYEAKHGAKDDAAKTEDKAADKTETKRSKASEIAERLKGGEVVG